MTVTGTGISGSVTIATVTNQNTLVLSSAQSLSDDVVLTFTKGGVAEIGGSVITATENAIIDYAHTIIGAMEPSGTSIAPSIRPTTATSPSGSQTSFSTLSATNARSIPLNDNYKFDAPHMACSSINETNELSGLKSLFLPLTLTTNSTTVSPVIDLQRATLLAVANRIDNIDSSSDVFPTTDFFASTEPEGDNNAAIYLTKKVSLENPATALKIVFAAHRPATSEIKLLYKILRTDDATDFDDISYRHFNTDGSPDETVPASADENDFKEYVYTATNNQTSFSGSDDNSNTLSYTPLFLQVFLNGVLLDNGTDYTATNGTAVVLVNGATTSDLLQISTFVQIIGSADAVTDEFTGDGSTTAFTLTADPDVEGNTMVFIDGVYQEKATYSISGTTLTFSTAPANGQSIEVNTGSRNVTVDDVSGLTIEGNLVVEGNTTLGNASSDTITVTGTPTFAEAVDINSTLNVSGHVSLDGSANELRFYEGSNYVGFEAPALSGDQIWVLPTADGTAGYALKTDGSGNLSWGLAGGNAFETIAISGQSSVVADSSSDTLTLAAGAGIALTTNASSDTITITNSSLGANAFQNIAVSGQTTVAADSTGDTVTLVGQNGVTITTTAGTDTVTFDGNKSINPFVTDLFTTANNSTTAFTLSTTPSTEDNLIVFVEGVYQNKNSYVISGTTLTLDGAPASGSEVVVHIIGDGVVGGGHTVNGFTGDNSTTAFTLTVAPMNENNTLVYLDGVYQHKSEYSVSGTTLTFSTAPGTGDDIEVLIPTTVEINQPGSTSIDNISQFDTTAIIPNEVTATTVASTSASTIATHAIATYRTVKYLVQCTQGTDYHSTEINVIHDGTTAYMTEYGTLFDNAALGTFDVAISGGNLLLQITAGSATSMAVKVISTAIPV